MMKTRASQRLDLLFNTGFPHPINLFAALMLTMLPLLSPYAGDDGLQLLPTRSQGLAGLLSLLYLVIWSRLRVFDPERSARYLRWYLIAQTAAVSLIYALDGGLTRFLFVLVAVQAVYISPVRRWGPYLGTLAALWLTLYLVISPHEPGSYKVATIGMYLLYLIFAALVTFTSVQQERQNRVAQELLNGVDQRHTTLRSLEVKAENRAEEEERERLAETICATLLGRLAAVSVHLSHMQEGTLPLDRQSARAVRMQAKDVLAAVRGAVRTLRPGEEGELEDEEPPFGPPPHPEVTNQKWTDPIRVYHIWNIGVIVVTTGVLLASALVGGHEQWPQLLGAGLALLAAYGGTAVVSQQWFRSLCLVTQAGLVVYIVAVSHEPLMNHLFLIIAAQSVFFGPSSNRWLLTAVLFPTMLSGAALWLTGGFGERPTLLLSLTAAFGVTNFFGAVMAYMTLRQVEARRRAVLYAEQLTEVNRLLEARLMEVRRIAIARERVRMAREIHDGLGHHLTIVIVELQYVEELAGEDPAAALVHVGEARRLIDVATTASKEMFETLERFDRPLPEAMHDLVSAWQKGNGVKVAVQMNGDFAGLSTAARITLYRVVQESLTNIQKHARARRVEIWLLQGSDRVLLTVTNDHTGGPVPAVEVGRGGFGLLGLKERAEALQGEFWAGPRPGGGFRVKLVLPLGA